MDSDDDDDIGGDGFAMSSPSFAAAQSGLRLPPGSPAGQSVRSMGIESTSLSAERIQASFLCGDSCHVDVTRVRAAPAAETLLRRAPHGRGYKVSES